MNVLRAYKTELDLNNAQATACKRHAGAARYAYNWGLVRKQEAYLATGGKSIGDRPAPRAERSQEERIAVDV